jgi:hypothetical protein
MAKASSSRTAPRHAKATTAVQVKTKKTEAAKKSGTVAGKPPAAAPVKRKMDAVPDRIDTTARR